MSEFIDMENQDDESRAKIVFTGIYDYLAYWYASTKEIEKLNEKLTNSNGEEDAPFTTDEEFSLAYKLNAIYGELLESKYSILRMSLCEGYSNTAMMRFDNIISRLKKHYYDCMEIVAWCNKQRRSLPRNDGRMYRFIAENTKNDSKIAIEMASIQIMYSGDMMGLMQSDSTAVKIREEIRSKLNK